MTKEEAIEWLKTMKDTIELYNDLSNSYTFDKYPQALDMAIEALSVETVQGVGRYENAMQKLREMPRYLNDVKAKQIKKISADRPNGEWVKTDGDSRYMCSVCKVHQDYVPTCMGESTIWDYCPSCGARMKGGTE